jgi:paraquat-inducible protein B
MLGMALFYLIIVVMVNIILDLQHPVQIIIAKALLSLVSIPAAVTLSIRQLHKTRLTDEANHKAEKTAQGKLGALTKQFNQLKQTNSELSNTIQGLNKQIKEQSKPTKQVQMASKPASKGKAKAKQKTEQKIEQIACPDCGKMVNGIKGLNGHKAWCKGAEVEVYSNGHTKELA